MTFEGETAPTGCDGGGRNKRGNPAGDGKNKNNNHNKESSGTATGPPPPRRRLFVRAVFFFRAAVGRGRGSFLTPGPRRGRRKGPGSLAAVTLTSRFWMVFARAAGGQLTGFLCFFFLLC
ncbi:uncharacterized protein TM35_000271410 [Trypanosoma theileri]|uniref:Uncharacterized protein n=1 Tax=Trypanosoma theileri TaxID=67003 RepID=A0A1X0NPM3_9TRYP|nr:uncharacterized protein TM35_000271410 [Trypanosoma theileri]ORC86551.1 hypothetical protein TM35_000271410 [Trypanosoma theileri]